MSYPGFSQEWPRVAVGIMAIVAAALDADPTIEIYPEDSPWRCFNCAGRSFGIWLTTTTGIPALYEADEHGAMGADPLDPVFL